MPAATIAGIHPDRLAAFATREAAAAEMLGLLGRG